MFDVIVIGGGPAGLSAALILGRARRRVLVLDDGRPRNAPAAHSQGFLTRDGTPPAELLRIAREQLEPYDTVEARSATAVAATRSAPGFTVELAGGGSAECRQILIAGGVTDELLPIPGLREAWGKAVHHCPYCHGWEVRDQPLAIVGAAHAYDRAVLLRAWSDQLTVHTNGERLEAGVTERLEGLGVEVETRPIVAIDAAGAEAVIRLGDGTLQTFGGAFVAPRQVVRSAVADSLGVLLSEQGPVGSLLIEADVTSGATSAPGVYAAGDAAAPQHSIPLAVASGARAAYAMNRELSIADAEAALSVSTAA